VVVRVNQYAEEDCLHSFATREVAQVSGLLPCNGWNALALGYRILRVSKENTESPVRQNAARPLDGWIVDRGESMV
jgi:hypothetical protein